MKTILVDTSVWINFFKGSKTPASLYLRSNLDNCLIATCPVIIQETLQGARSDQHFRELKNFFLNLVQLSEGSSLHLAIQAATLYRTLRKSGATIRKPNGCLIACYSINNDIPILYDDRDFDLISKYSDLKKALTPETMFEEPEEPYQ